MPTASLRCPSCSAPVGGSAARCPACGAALDNESTPTGTAPHGKSPSPPGSRGASAGNATPRPAAARFVPGTLLAHRYRIVGLLAKGGLGEVYRADDLRLGQPIALKLLPEALQND